MKLIYTGNCSECGNPQVVVGADTLDIAVMRRALDYCQGFEREGWKLGEMLPEQFAASSKFLTHAEWCKFKSSNLR